MTAEQARIEAFRVRGQPRPRSRSLSGLRASYQSENFVMEKLKISALPDDKPVKVALELPAQVHRDLVAYAEVLSRKTPSKYRAGEARRADARSVHGHGSSLLQKSRQT